VTVSSPAAASADLEVDVAIVGAGPVGLVLGVQLAQRGRSAVILEQWPSPYPLPRAVHFDHEVGRILQSCGIGDQVRAASEPATIYEWQNGAGTTLLRFGRIGAAASGWPFSSMFCQPELEGLLDQRAAALPGLDVRRGVQVRSIDQHDDHVVVGCVPVGLDGDHQLVEAAGGPRSVRAGYVVGCDGANSTIRELLGIPVDDRGFFYDWLIVDVILDQPRVFDPVNLQVCDPARPTTAVSGGPGRRRWEFMRLPDERIEDLNRESRAWELLAPWDVHPGNARLERHAVYTFQARVAERWQVGRALVAGDAAHQMPPFAGQGMCAGLRDAANLAWKLDLVIGGRAAPELLATYEQERRPSASAAVDFSIELGKVICVPDPAEAAARDEVMAAGFDGTVSDAPGIPGLTTGLVQAGRPAAGELFGQGDLDGQRFDDVCGVGFRLVTVDPAAADLDPALVAWFVTIGGAVVDVRGISEDLAAWFDTNRARWALQRPDFYLFGTAADLSGATAMLDELRHRLIPSAVG
jgi:2-polyprenyl-6-methoxyphenol hydroxylase-like FAD-dependent oxidoreductase